MSAKFFRSLALTRHRPAGDAPTPAHRAPAAHADQPTDLHHPRHADNPLWETRKTRHVVATGSVAWCSFTNP